MQSFGIDFTVPPPFFFLNIEFFLSHRKLRYPFLDLLDLLDLPPNNYLIFAWRFDTFICRYMKDFCYLLLIAINDLTIYSQGVLPSSGQAPASKFPTGGWDSLILTTVGNLPTTHRLRNQLHIGSATKSWESSEIGDFKGVHYLDSYMLISKMILESQNRRPLFIYCQAQFQLAS